MPAVLVHGNPETPALWDPVRPHLTRSDVVALALPGFGNRAPGGFGATKEEYVDWLTDELAAMGEPVDLVGHDWGGGFVLRVACTRPDLLRSWVSDVAGLFDPAYVWHPFAQTWQTPGAGEQYFANALAQPIELRVEQYVALGIPSDVARAFATAMDDEMARCVLALYRSAAQPAMVDWGRDAEQARARPGLVVAPDGDPYTGGVDMALRVAERMGARSQVLDGAGHWWMLQDPAGAARLLEEFWSSIP